MSASNIQVAIKVRPILGKEKEQKQSSYWRVSGNSIQLDGQPEPFYFDHIFDQDVNNQVIFDTMAKQIVDSGIKGFNGTIFAYGQTSSGKTYTMMGEKTNPGVMELATKEIFKEIEKASDRQFLLRVGYIEIYNEKIYDLLNKSNQDLKIHETPNGDVGVNCTEYIITSENDLLSYLRMGSKQRKSGETNMNERSSRSHAIFRIIIESRKTDNTDDDSVQISILNLVDLAGSERADQTGATGSRLKEGSHINKSLLFLSCVIKQLAEDSYVSYRDSKLTRILQASLGGNALTAIICTINPTAIDETLSTLSFANRAKVVKNKPQLNEVMTDAAMMKRLEKEINRLQIELEEEKTKNSQIKVGQLQKRINDEILKIINSNSSNSSKTATEKRRRTWCPSSLPPPIIEINSDSNHLPQPTMASQMPTKLQLPKSVINFTPHITLRDVYYQEQFKEMQCSPSIEEEFIPAEEACFDDMRTPRSSPSLHLKAGFQTPKQVLNLRTTSLTPRLTEKESLQKVERELKELEAFTNLENQLNVDHDTYNTLKYKLENAEQVIAGYEKEREELAFIKVEYIEATTNLTNCQKRCRELESQVIDLTSKVYQLELETSASEDINQCNSRQIERYEKEITELNKKVTQIEMENREVVSLEFEYQQHKHKTKLRETELLGALEEKQKEIKRLEQSLHTVTNEVLNNSKEELRQISQGVADAETVCVKCKDLHQLLTENKQLTQNFEKLDQEYKTLQTHLEKLSFESESEKLRADSLEAENDGLNKKTEHLQSLHGTVADLQNQIGSLQAEKCKLETVKIEFEVMSKENANKIAERISISQEIEKLNIQKDNLSVECVKLLAAINVNDELNKLRKENASLHSELLIMKTKLETTQSDYAHLLTENQTKSANYETLNMEVLSARNQLQTLQGEYKDIQQKYEQIQAECNKHEGTIGEIQSEYASIQEKYQGLQREYEKLENDSVQSIADCDRVQNQNENLETEIRDLKIKVEEAQRKLLENDSLQLELESLKSEMNRLQGEYEKSVALKRKSASPIKEQNGIDLRQENAQLKHDLEKLQTQFNEMQKEYDDISTQLVDNFADYETLQGEVAKLEDELKKYTASADGNQEESDDFKSMKLKTKQLEVENSHLAKENAEWKKTISMMTDSMREKCDETEQLVVQLEEAKNLSALSSVSPKKSAANCKQFIELADTFSEIEIPAGNGRPRLFQAAGCHKMFAGCKMIIGSISEITQGSFNELRGTIEFAVDHKPDNEIYDSLEVEDNLKSANSCDSLDGTGRQPHEAQINEWEDEKSQLFQKIREQEESIAKLKSQNQLLEGLQIDVEQLNCEKIHLLTIGDENKCKINDLNDIITRAESENKKLIVDCQQLKKAVESESAMEGVSREIYEELKRQNEEMCEKLDKVEEYEEKCAELKEQLLSLQAKLGDEENVKEFNSQDACRCDEYKSEVFKLEAMVNDLSEQLKIKDDLPTRFELEDTITELHDRLQACKCAEMQVDDELGEKRDDKTAKYEQDICALLEQLKQQECKCQEVQIEIIELKTSLEEKIKETTEGAAKYEDLSGRFKKLQIEYDEQESQIACERKKAAELDKTLVNLEKMAEECTILQNSVACLSQTISSLGIERNEIRSQKESLEKDYNTLNEKLLAMEQESTSLKKNSHNELSELTAKLMILIEEKKAVLEECQILRNSERSLHEQLQKLVQDHELSVRDKERLERECHESNIEKCESNSREMCEIQQKCNQLREDLNAVSAEKERITKEFSEANQQSSNEIAKLKEECEFNCREKCEIKQKCEQLKEDLNAVSAEKERITKEFSEANQQSSNEIAKLKEECEFNCREKCEIKQKCEQLKENLNAVSAEKERITKEFSEANQQSSNEIAKLKEECELNCREKCEIKQKCEQLKEDLNAVSAEKERIATELSEANQQSSNEIAKLRKECESNSREKCEIQQKCEQLKENLNKVSAEKNRLVEELAVVKEQHEILKESHKEERNRLEVKCSSLVSEIDVLVNTKNELQSALDKTKKHSEFLLEQGKDMEEQLNLELCTVRNSNNSMAQQIDELYEKLEKAESDLKLAQEPSDKDDVIVLLTSTNNLLSAKSSELATNLALAKEELEQANHLQLAIEKGIAEKDELIAQLSTKCSELETSFALLTQQLKDLKDDKDTLITKGADLENEFLLLQQALAESNQSLSTEVHLKEVLEKAKTERDDLIVKLTNNNNSLVTKSNELKEKLAILGNQFEESKRHLSGEVVRLKELLSESSQVALDQSSHIEILTNKIQVLEASINTTQSATSERDALQQELDKIQAKYESLAREHANLKQRRSSFEAELKSAKDFEVQKTALEQKVNKLQIALQDAQLNCNSLNSANEKLELTNKSLAKHLEDAKSECKTLNNNIAKLRGQIEKYKIDWVEWQSKETSFMERVSQLQGNISSLTSENKTLQATLENDKKLSLSKISSLEQKIEALQKETNTSLSKSISPKREKAIDHLLGENHQLKVKNMNLMDKLDSCQKSQNEERKNRRLSTHDERRRQSFWDSNRDVSTMTEPTNSECNCSELDRKLTELKQKLLIRDSQVNTLSMELKNHPLKMENATLKKLLNEEESKQHKLRQDIKKCQQLIVSKTNERKHCEKCSEAAKRIIVESSTQTADRDETECFRKLLSKYEDLKMICRVRHTKIKELEDALSKGKENEGENSSSPHNQQYRQKYDLLKKELKVVQEKYWEAKMLCNLRSEQIKDLTNQVSKKS